MHRVVKRIGTGLCLAFLVWCLLSYVEVVSKNMSANPQYSNLNIIVWAVENIGK